MSGLFFDTNVIVYAHDPADPRKQSQARAAMHDAMVGRTLVISTQVMQEFYSVVLRRQWMSPAQASQVLRLLAGYTVVPADSASVLRALELQQRYRLSVWDALIVQSAIDARCSVLYSEDLQAGMRFDALWVCGLDAARWPPPAAPDPFLPRTVQLLHGLPRSAAELADTEARQVLARLVASADEVVLSVAQMEDDAPLLPSPLLAGIAAGAVVARCACVAPDHLPFPELISLRFRAV